MVSQSKEEGNLIALAHKTGFILAALRQEWLRIDDSPQFDIAAYLGDALLQAETLLTFRGWEQPALNQPALHISGRAGEFLQGLFALNEHFWPPDFAAAGLTISQQLHRRVLTTRDPLEVALLRADVFVAWFGLEQLRLRQFSIDEMMMMVRAGNPVALLFYHLRWESFRVKLFPQFKTWGILAPDTQLAE